MEIQLNFTLKNQSMNTVNTVKKILIGSVFSTVTLSTTCFSVKAVNIGLFNQSPFTFPIETANLIEALEPGNSLTEFSELGSLTWQAIADNNQVIVIPSNEGASLFQALPETTRNVIRDYVSNGGGLLTMGLGLTAIELLNGLFGYNIEENFVGGDVLLNLENAVGTIFETAPSSLPPLAFIDPLRLSTLPNGSISFYDHSSNPDPDFQDSTSVFVSPFGQGKVGFNAFNYSTAPSEAEGWPEATNLTVEFIAADEAESIPESSSLLGILAIGILGSVTIVYNAKN